MTNNCIYPDMYSFQQHTLRNSFSIIGVGLHTGLKSIMSVFPADINTGYTFIRRDVPSAHGKIVARWNNVVDTHLSTTISNSMGVRVSTVEHILAALYASGVDNAHIVVDAPEVPIVDGSAETFTALINRTGLAKQDAPRRAIVIEKPIAVVSGEKSAMLSPARQTHIDVEISLDHPLIGRQQLVMPLNREVFNKEIADARTFGFNDQIGVLRDLGFCRGSSVDNAVVVDGETIVNQGGLRYPDEFVRHKYLDAVGDLALLGCQVLGKYTGRSSDHQLNNMLLLELMVNAESWSYHSLEGAHAKWARMVGE